MPLPMPPRRPLTPLCALARVHQTDKGGRHHTYGGDYTDLCHEYTPVYDDLFRNRRASVKAVLEIGICKGCSLRMWEAYFQNARIDGLDIDSSTLFQAGRIATMQADQTHDISICTALGALGHAPYDLIVDDGCHGISEQIAAMKILLPFVAEGGIYITEDLEKACEPERLLTQIPEGFVGVAVHTPEGDSTNPLKGRCSCQCGGPETIVVIRRADDVLGSLGSADIHVLMPPEA